jgi:hypothetical protein
VPGCGIEGVVLGVVGLLPVLVLPLPPLLVRWANAEMEMTRIRIAERRMELNIRLAPLESFRALLRSVHAMLRLSTGVSATKTNDSGTQRLEGEDLMRDVGNNGSGQNHRMPCARVGSEAKLEFSNYVVRHQSRSGRNPGRNLPPYDDRAAA